MSGNRPYWISIACAQSGRIGAAASRWGSPAKAEGTGAGGWRFACWHAVRGVRGKHQTSHRCDFIAQIM